MFRVFWKEMVHLYISCGIKKCIKLLVNSFKVFKHMAHDCYVKLQYSLINNKGIVYLKIWYTTWKLTLNFSEVLNFAISKKYF